MSLSLGINYYSIGSEPLLKAASDDIVACLAKVFDRWVSLSNLVDLGVAVVLKRGATSWFVNRV